MYYVTGEKRTGCMFCAYGIDQEGNQDNKFLRLKNKYPKIWYYVINNLGFGYVLDLIGINYGKENNND